MLYIVKILNYELLQMTTAEAPANQAMGRLKYYQASAFVCGWISYASTYTLRKPLGVVSLVLQTASSSKT